MYACTSKAAAVEMTLNISQLRVGGGWCLPVKCTPPDYLTARYRASSFPLPGESWTHLAKGVIQNRVG